MPTNTHTHLFLDDHLEQDIVYKGFGTEYEGMAEVSHLTLGRAVAIPQCYGATAARVKTLHDSFRCPTSHVCVCVWFYCFDLFSLIKRLCGSKENQFYFAY